MGSGGRRDRQAGEQLADRVSGSGSGLEAAWVGMTKKADLLSLGAHS